MGRWGSAGFLGLLPCLLFPVRSSVRALVRLFVRSLFCFPSVFGAGLFVPGAAECPAGGSPEMAVIGCCFPLASSLERFLSLTHSLTHSGKLQELSRGGGGVCKILCFVMRLRWKAESNYLDFHMSHSLPPSPHPTQTKMSGSAAGKQVT